MTVHTRRLLAVVAMAVGVLALLAAPAAADNCGTPADCFTTARAAVATAVGVGVFGAIVSIGLDLSPVGTVKGIYEAFTGRDAITGEELGTFERFMGAVPGVGGLLGTAAAATRFAGRVDALGDAARAGDTVGDAARAADGVAGATSAASRSGGGSSRASEVVGTGDGPIRSRYADGVPVYQGQQPPRISGPDPQATGPHSVLRWDQANGRTYQSRQYDDAGSPVRDIDFTAPTYPNGRVRPDHLPLPQEHRWEINDPRIGARSGFRRGPGHPYQGPEGGSP